MSPLTASPSILRFLRFKIDILPQQAHIQKSISLTSVGNVVQAIVGKLARYFIIAIKWSLWQIWRGLVGLWRFFRIQKLLGWIAVQVLLILKWIVILIVAVLGIVLVIRSVTWVAKKILVKATSYLELRLLQREMKEAKLEHERWIAEHQAREAKAAADKQKEIRRAAQERRIRDAEDAALRERLQQAEMIRKKNIEKQYEVWKQECKAAFANARVMDRFPYPPVGCMQRFHEDNSMSPQHGSITQALRLLPCTAEEGVAELSH